MIGFVIYKREKTNTKGQIASDLFLFGKRG